MATSRRGGAFIAHGPTELGRYLPISILATAIVAGVPLWILLSLGQDLGFVATILSVVLSFALADIGARAWKKWPGSRDVVFNDLMLWGYCRRIVTQRRLIRRVERLGFSTSDHARGLTIAERTDLIKKMAIALETGDPYTHGHSQRVARHAYLVAKTMKLPREQAEKIRLAGVIHDVGKLRIPRRIITKPGKLTDAEFDVVKRHTVDGAAMVEELGDPELVDMVRHHHERLDGSGYPDNLTEEFISTGARVLAVADTFDAASSHRPYRAARKHQIALDVLREDAEAGRLDPDVVDAFIRYYSGGRALKWWAFLSTGPVHLYEFTLAFGQRASAAGLANAAVVGLTAAAIVPGVPLHGLGMEQRDGREERRVVDEGGAQKDWKPGSPGASPTTPRYRAPGVASTEATGDPRTDRREDRSRDENKRPDRATEPDRPSSEDSKDKERASKDEGRPDDDTGSEASVAATVEENTSEATSAATEQLTNDDRDTHDRRGRGR